ncbi:MAG: fumarylacetoacetate hydrolase family protein [Planctomycetaceae bacterium]|nr:fumarylacetoacetate hydrolase family protein [Planctomycetaceae bacterium]
MKLATFEIASRQSFGVVREDRVVDIPTLWPDGPATLLAAFEAGPQALATIAALASAAHRSPLATHDLKSVRLLAPLPAPPKLLGLAVNYLEHHREFDRGHDMPDDPSRTTTPRPFLMPTTAVAGPGDEIPWPAFSRQIDYEVELAVVIGRTARRVSAKDAMDFVAGYTIANDISARSCTHAQGRGKRPKDDFFDWLHGKWADAFCPMGPWMVTADEVGDPQKLAIGLSVNGETRQQSSTELMIHSVAEIVSFCSHLMTLAPGDVIATGTPSGVGMASGRFLAAGDRITCTIEKIGDLTNTLGSAPAEFYEPCNR